VAVPTEFNNVWFTPRRNWWNLKLLAYDDKGTLTINGDSLEFRGGGGLLMMNDIRNVSLGKHGRDFVNDWVIVNYLNGQIPLTACFADGNNLGWGGALGGTRQIFDAIKKITRTAG
jgi:hypothetical protein